MSDVLVAAFISDGHGAAEGQIELSYSDNGDNWGTCPSALLSAAPVGLTVFNDCLWVAGRGHTSNSLFVSSSSNGKSVEIGGHSNLSPCLTVFKNHLWMAFIGEDTGNVEVISSNNGTTWSTKPTATRKASKLPPSITVFQNQLWVAFIGEAAGHIELLNSTDGASWPSTSIDTGRSSNLPPSLTVFQEQLWVAYIDEATGNVEVISSDKGTTWSVPSATGKASKFPPSITAFQNQLWVAFIGEATGHVELLNSGGGASWSLTSIDTGQSSQNGPSLAAAPAVQPVTGFGGAAQYIFASPQGNGWPEANVTLPPILNLSVQIKITEELRFDPSKPLSFQLNCCAPPSGNWKIGWQQYVLMMQPNSTEMFLHIQNFGPTNGSLAVYAGNSSNQINFPSTGAIPAGWFFQLVLQYTGNIVSGASCVVSDDGGVTVGVLKLDSIGIPLALQSGTVDGSWLAPIVAFQLVVVGYAEGAHTTFTSGNGFVIYESATPLVAANTWAGSACAGGGGTAESSNCAYSVVADVANVGMVQCFGAPPSA